MLSIDHLSHLLIFFCPIDLQFKSYINFQSNLQLKLNRILFNHIKIKTNIINNNKTYHLVIKFNKNLILKFIVCWWR